MHCTPELKEARREHRPPRRLPDRPLALQTLEAQVRRPGRHARRRLRRERRHRARLQAQAQQLRPGRGHRAQRRHQPHPLRTPRSAHGGRHQPEGQGLLLGRQHLHARRQQPCVEGELLQVHQRDAQRPRGFVQAQRAEVPGRRQRLLRRRRLRAGAGLRRDHPGRRPQQRGEPARGAAAGRAARHRRPDARHRQAACAPRPGRHLLHHHRRRARAEGQGLAAGRRHRQAGAVCGQGAGACAAAGGAERPSGRRQGRGADAAAAHDRARRAALSACHGADRPQQAHGHLHGEGAGRRATRRHRRHRGGRCRLVPAAAGARAGRRHPVDAHQRTRHRHLADQDRRRCRRGAGDGRHAAGAPRALAGARNHRAAAPQLQPAGRVVAQPVRADRARLLLRRHAARTGAGLRPQLPAGAARRARACAEDHRRRSQLRQLPDGHRPEPPAAPLLRRTAGPGGRARQGRASRSTATPRWRWAW